MKMRLILWPDCPRRCPGCCNNDFDIDALPVPGTFKGYNEIILTGGEPLMWPVLAANAAIVARAGADEGARVLLYTANYGIAAHRRVLPYVDGLTITLHEQADVEPFMRLYNWLCEAEVARFKSLRLNVFEGVVCPDRLECFKIKSGIVWRKDCPLPEGEVLMRLDDYNGRAL